MDSPFWLTFKPICLLALFAAPYCRFHRKISDPFGEDDLSKQSLPTTAKRVCVCVWFCVASILARERKQMVCAIMKAKVNDLEKRCKDVEVGANQ